MATATSPLRSLRNPKIRRQWFALLYTLGLTPLPLVGTLGYENSLALTAPFSILGACIGVDVIRELRTTPTNKLQESTVLQAAARLGLSELAWLLAISVAVMFASLLMTTNCDPLGGLVFFVMGPACSGVLGWICGLWGGVLSRGRRAQIATALLPIFACLGVALWRLYAQPVVFAFDPFWGYFSGPLYDEAVRVDARYLWFRAYNGFAAAAALGAFYLWTDRASKQLARKSSGEKGKKADKDKAKAKASPGALAPVTAHPWVATLTFVAAAAAASFGFRPAHHGFTATVESLSEALIGTRESEHFIIHYAANSASARDLDLLVAEHEFAWNELAQTLQRAPTHKIHSFVFPSPMLKRRLLGAGRTEVAPPWRGHIYLNHQSFPHRVLQHELAHAFSATVGDPVFGISGHANFESGVRLNMAMVEGFATALAPRPRDGLDLHDQAAVLDRLGKRPGLEGIMGVSFWGKASRRAYTAAGSFCLWLLETRGIEPLTRLYASGGDVHGTYGVPLAQLETEWLEFLKTRPIDEHAIETQRERFRRTSIFRRPCAHQAANLKNEANVARARGDRVAGLKALRTLCSIEPQQPHHRLLLATEEARGEEYDDAITTLDGAASLPELTATVRSVVDERRGDIALMRGDLVAAVTAYEAALATPGLNQSRTRQLQLKWYAARDPRLAGRIVDYYGPFKANHNLPSRVTQRVYAAMEIGELREFRPLSDYLVGRQLLNAHAGADAAGHFERSLVPKPGELPLPSVEFVRAAHYWLVEAYARTRDYDRAESHLKILREMPGSSSGQLMGYERWARRLTFLRAYMPTPPRGDEDPIAPNLPLETHAPPVSSTASTTELANPTPPGPTAAPTDPVDARPPGVTAPVPNPNTTATGGTNTSAASADSTR